MSKIINKENRKKLIITIVIIMLFNFVMPNYSQAGLLSTLTNFFSNLIVMVTDSLISGLQSIFVGDGAIKNDVGKYSIKFSPGTIFAGKIAWFNINFIKETEGNAVSSYAMEPILNTLISNNRCYNKVLVTKYDISSNERTNPKSNCKSRRIFEWVFYLCI